MRILKIALFSFFVLVGLCAIVFVVWFIRTHNDIDGAQTFILAYMCFGACIAIFGYGRLLKNEVKLLLT